MDDSFYNKRLLLKRHTAGKSVTPSVATLFPFCIRLIAAVCVTVDRAALSAVFV